MSVIVITQVRPTSSALVFLLDAVAAQAAAWRPMNVSACGAGGAAGAGGCEAGAAARDARRLIDSFERFCGVRRNADIYAALMTVALVESEPPALPGTPLLPPPPLPPPAFRPYSRDPPTDEQAVAVEAAEVIQDIGGAVTDIWREAVREGTAVSVCEGMQQRLLCACAHSCHPPCACAL